MKLKFLRPSGLTICLQNPYQVTFAEVKHHNPVPEALFNFTGIYASVYRKDMPDHGRERPVVPYNRIHGAGFKPCRVDS